MLGKISECGFIVVIEGKSNYVFYMVQGNPLRCNVSGLSEVVRWQKVIDIDYARANVSLTFGELTLILFEDDDELRYLIMQILFHQYGS